MTYRIYLIAGIILFLRSLVFFKDSFAFLRSSERTSGTVTRLDEFPGEGGMTYTPVFRMKTKQNQEIIYIHTSYGY